MPIINGCKYSCEPCIRGHRATSCKHTDRMLIEVRKPGRPLESCGHDFATCTCKKLDEWLATGQVISSFDLGQRGKDITTNFIAVCPPPDSQAKKARLSRVREQRQSVKRRKRNTKFSPSSASSGSSTKDSTSTETSSVGGKVSAGETIFQADTLRKAEDPHFSARQQVDSTLSWINAPQFLPRYPSLPIAQLLNDVQDFQGPAYQQEPEHFVVREETQPNFPPQDYRRTPKTYLSQVEDLVLTSSEPTSIGFGEAQTHIQAQYIGAGQNIGWK